MASFFPEAIRRLLAAEGGYSNQAADRGGETFLGISRRYFPDWEGWRVIAGMRGTPSPTDPKLVALAHQFYRTEFYDRTGGDKLGDQRLANEMLDQAVNLGVGRANSHLQEAINLLNRGGRDVLKVDGSIGPATLAELRRLDPVHVYRVLNALQAEHYLQICRRDPSQETFLRGWLERTI